MRLSKNIFDWAQMIFCCWKKCLLDAVLFCFSTHTSQVGAHVQKNITPWKQLCGHLEHSIRKALEAENETIPSRLKKPNNNPTARWIFELFEDVLVVTVRLETGFTAQ